MARRGEGAGAHVRCAARFRQRQQFCEPSATLGIVATHIPDVSQRHRDTKTRLGVALPDRPQECCPQIVLFSNHVLRVPRVMHAWRLHISGKQQTPGQMPFANRRDLARLFEAFPRVLTDRLEKVETQPLWTLVFNSHKRLVEQLLEQLQHPI